MSMQWRMLCYITVGDLNPHLRELKNCASSKTSVKSTELYYISGDRALIQSQSKKCPRKHGGFLPKIRHFDVTVMAQTTDQTAIHK